MNDNQSMVQSLCSGVMDAVSARVLVVVAGAFVVDV
jgi:hypothetical protein